MAKERYFMFSGMYKDLWGTLRPVSHTLIRNDFPSQTELKEIIEDHYNVFDPSTIIIMAITELTKEEIEIYRS